MNKNSKLSKTINVVFH